MSSPPVVVVAGDDPRDASAETKLTLPDTWLVDSMGMCQRILSAEM